MWWKFQKKTYFSEGFPKRQYLGDHLDGAAHRHDGAAHHLDGDAHLELALHHRALADRGDVDRVLARTRGVVPWNSQ